jgi:hypothetical protein
MASTVARTAALLFLLSCQDRRSVTLLAVHSAEPAGPPPEAEHARPNLNGWVLHPGVGPVLAAEFLGATGGDLTVFKTADRFAGVVGLAPAPNDSGRITGNHRPRGYDRRLLRVFYLSGLSALKSCPASRTYYDRKRAEGKTHVQAMLSPARRRNQGWLLDGRWSDPAVTGIDGEEYCERRGIRH